MAKVILHPTIQSLRGKLGNLVFRRNHNGTLSVTKSPDMSRVKWSPAQQEHRQRFREAVACAKAAMADPVQRAEYESAAASKGMRAFDLAVSDFYHGHKMSTHEDPA
jgi:hypothetical protein